MISRDPAIGPAPPALAARLAFYYGAIFLVMGVYLPFWPVWLEARGVGPGEIGLLLAITTWTKVFASPAMAQIADRLGEQPSQQRDSYDGGNQQRRPFIANRSAINGEKPFGGRILYPFDPFGVNPSAKNW